MLKKKHHTKLIMATAFGAFFLTVGLATGAYLSMQSQDTRNQAWGGRNRNFNAQEAQNMRQNAAAMREQAKQAREQAKQVREQANQFRQQAPNQRMKVKVDGKEYDYKQLAEQARNQRGSRGAENKAMIPENLAQYQKYLTGRNCDYESYGRFCSGNTLRTCTRQGKEVHLNCGDFDATCGVIPAGKNVGKAACIPNKVGKTSLPGDVSFEQAQKYIKGNCSNKGTSSCKNNVMTACTPNGYKLVVPCTEVDATCGVIPAGKYAGKAACIPNDLPEIPKVGDPRTGDGRNWPKLVYPSLGVPSVSPLNVNY